VKTVTKQIRLGSAARSEAQAAYKYYFQRDPAVADRFADEFDRQIERLRTVSETGREYMHGARRLLMKKFPYLIVFRVYSNYVSVIAVSHGRRRPGYLHRRKE
jgi:toxin ParE1/3/4